MTSGETESIAIIGGGITGLSAAWKLQRLRPAAKVTLLESANRVGGVLQTEKIAGYLVEAAADMFTTQPATALELSRELGIEDDLLLTKEPANKAFVGIGEKVVPVPQGFSLMVPATDDPVWKWPLMSEAGKQRLLNEATVAARDYDLDDSDEDFASFAIRRFGQEAFDTLIQPLVSGIYSADPQKLSMNATMQRFVEMEKEHGSLIKAVRKKAARESTSDSRASGARYSLFRTPRDGFGGFVKSMIHSMPNLEVRTGVTVEQLQRRTDSRWDVTCGFGKDVTVDQLILATPADVTSRILPSTMEFATLKETLNEIRSTSCAIVAMGIDRCELPEGFEGFGIIYPHIDQGSTIAISFASNKFDYRAPDGKVLLRFFLGGAMQEDLVELSDDELIEISLAQFERSMSSRPTPEFTNVFRWKKAMPQYHVGHLERVDRIDECVACIDHLELAGKSYRGVGIPACITSGFEAAARLARSI